MGRFIPSLNRIQFVADKNNMKLDERDNMTKEGGKEEPSGYGEKKRKRKSKRL